MTNGESLVSAYRLSLFLSFSAKSNLHRLETIANYFLKALNDEEYASCKPTRQKKFFESGSGNRLCDSRQPGLESAT